MYYLGLTRDSYIPATNKHWSEILAEDKEKWDVKLKVLHKATPYWVV